MAGIDHTGKMGAGGEFAKQVEQWQTPKAGEEDSGSGMNSRGEPKLKAQAMQWATPQAHDQQGGKTPEQIQAMRSKTGAGARNLVEDVSQWRTPDTNECGGAQDATKRLEVGHSLRLQDQVHSWPTPAARDHKGKNSAEHALVTGGGRKHMDQLSNFVAYSPQAQAIQGGQESSSDGRTSRPRLNPHFVEWLMGWPIGWTSAGESGLGHVEMASFRSRQQQHLSSLLDSKAIGLLNANMVNLERYTKAKKAAALTKEQTA